MKMKTILITTLLVTGITFATPSPRLIPFQGRLTDQANVPYNSGQYTLTFNLYADAVGGTSLWTERHESVGVINGMVNVFLGSISSLDNVDFSQTLYLGITIDADGNMNTADPEMIPRQLIIPAFSAKNSEKLAGHDWTAILEGASNDPTIAKILASKLQADGITAGQINTGAVEGDEILNNTIDSVDIKDGTIAEADLSASLQFRLSDGLMPAGVVIPFAGPTNTIPAGWLLCDGSALASTNYPNLYASIGTSWGDGTDDGFTETDFRVPDMRGYFLRGVDHGAGNDPDVAARTNQLYSGASTLDAVGSSQQDELRMHDHGLPNAPVVANGGEQYYAADGAQSGTARAWYIHQTEGGNETRPKNVYVNYIIKY